jgi:hypothetical protein
MPPELFESVRNDLKEIKKSSSLTNNSYACTTSSSSITSKRTFSDSSISTINERDSDRHNNYKVRDSFSLYITMFNSKSSKIRE